MTPRVMLDSGSAPNSAHAGMTQDSRPLRTAACLLAFRVTLRLSIFLTYCRPRPEAAECPQPGEQRHALGCVHRCRVIARRLHRARSLCLEHGQYGFLRRMED